MTLFTAAPAFRTAMIETCRQLYADSDVEVIPGALGGGYWPDKFVQIQTVEGDQAAATMGSNRTREEALTLDVIVWVGSGGGEEVDGPLTEEAYDTLGRLEYFTRVTDTTLGGVVRECMLTAHASAGAGPDETDQGRFIQIEATFNAKARVRGT